jgi:26S proteasome non-ATPase regulatory subunit 9
MSADPREKTLKLIRAKDAIEAELKSLAEELNSTSAEGPATVDNEGFPRADLDVYDVRQKRHRFNCLQTDHKQIMASIEEVRAQSVTELSADPPPPPYQNQGKEDLNLSSVLDVISHSTTTKTDTTDSGASMEELANAFAIVNEVAPGGPAEEAGLLVNDLLFKVGDIDYQNHRNLAAVGQLIQASEGQTVPIIVLRQPLASLALENYQPVEIALTPQSWAGRGLLGCHLLPR